MTEQPTTLLNRYRSQENRVKDLFEDIGKAKRCCICLQHKPASQYHKRSASRDGLMAACKACHYERHKRSVAKKPEQYAAWRDEWKRNNPLSVRAYQVAYRKRNPEVMRERRRIRADRDRYDPAMRPKVLARQRVKAAIRRGTMTRKPCERCGATEKIHAHHEDYARPMDVIWLCHACHVEHHGGRPTSRLGQDAPPKESISGKKGG